MFKTHLQTIVKRKDLDQNSMAELMDAIFNGKLTDTQIGALMAALATKGETFEELAGAARSMRRRRFAFRPPDRPLWTPAGPAVTVRKPSTYPLPPHL